MRSRPSARKLPSSQASGVTVAQPRTRGGLPAEVALGGVVERVVDEVTHQLENRAEARVQVSEHAEGRELEWRSWL